MAQRQKATHQTAVQVRIQMELMGMGWNARLRKRVISGGQSGFEVTRMEEGAVSQKFPPHMGKECG
jgi:hypothetical protein